MLSTSHKGLYQYILSMPDENAYLKPHIHPKQTPSSLSAPRHEQSPLAMLLPKLDLSHVIKREVLPRPSTNKYIPDALFRESMVRHGPQGLLVSSQLDVAVLAPVAMSMGIIMVVVVLLLLMMVMMVIMTTRRPRIMRRVRKEVDNQEDPAWLQPRREPLRRKVRVVKVVEAEPDDREVEPRKLIAAKGLWVLVLWHAEVAVERGHLILGEALATAVSTRKEAWLLRGLFFSLGLIVWGGFWKVTKAYLVTSPGIICIHHLLRKVNTHTLRRVWRKGLSHRHWLVNGLGEGGKTNNNRAAT